MWRTFTRLGQGMSWVSYVPSLRTVKTHIRGSRNVGVALLLGPTRKTSTLQWTSPTLVGSVDGWSPGPVRVTLGSSLLP